MDLQHNSAEAFDVAVIGLGARFPGSRTLNEFWTNLSQGHESVRAFTDSELLSRGVNALSLRDPTFVKAASVLEDIEWFASSFFGYSPREAELMDPQHRVFLECAWEALEDAGYPPRHVTAQVGVYAAASLSAYLLFNLVGNTGVNHQDETFQAMIGSDKDFLATRVSYKLNLKGPSISIQSGCSSSLVAIALAVQSLLTLQCDLALAGGISINVPQRTGYFYQAGGITSRDGHCRPFSADGEGTLFGDGTGIVVLKRLEDALREHDHIYAVVRGVALNNDGSAKIGYTAPSVEGQAAVISRAHALAGVEPESISYIETHGTGTALGDPAEVAALARAFGESRFKMTPCALGSVKGNLGHLDAAAGVAGFIKTVLMLQHRKLVPSLNFAKPNPLVDFSGTRFFVNTKFQDWHHPTGILRAGVSSFGIGGTNAHVVLEQPPAKTRSSSSRTVHIITVSAKSLPALENASHNLASHIVEHSPDLVDIAYTLHVGREAFGYRRALVCGDATFCSQALDGGDPGRVYSGQATNRDITFLFPGGGTQYPGMGYDLYQHERAFRKAVNSCAELLIPTLGYDLREIMYPQHRDIRLAGERLARPSAGLPAIFVTEYALAMLLISWGIRPGSMLGHSLGEYVAACIAQVFTIEDALALVVLRGQLLETLPAGAMVAVYLSEHDIATLALKGVSLAAVNGPEHCVLSGPRDAIGQAVAVFRKRGIEFQHLHIEAAAHSSLVVPVIDSLRSFISKIELREPTIALLSNVSGDWMTPRDATDPEYWCRHLRQAVRFSDAIQTIAQNENHILLEVGPGRSLTTLAASQLRDKHIPVLSTLKHPKDLIEADLSLYTAVARIWVAGVKIDWAAFHSDEDCQRISLPTYPFERQRHWIEPAAVRETAATEEGVNAESLFYLPSWQRTLLPSEAEHKISEGPWLIICGDVHLGNRLTQRLRQMDAIAALAICGINSINSNDAFPLRPYSRDDYQLIFQGMALPKAIRLKVIHLLTLTEIPNGEDRYSGFFSLLALAQSAWQQSLSMDILVLTSFSAQVGGDDTVDPERGMLHAACTTISQELENVDCKLVDVCACELSPSSLDALCDRIICESSFSRAEKRIAYRGSVRWRQEYVKMPLCHVSSRCFERSGGVYLLTGGLGNIGLVLAQFLSRTPCKLVFTTRSTFPERHEWSHVTDARTSHQIEILESLERAGCEIAIFTADVSDEQRMREVVPLIEARFGRVSGVFHLAGITGEDTLRLVVDLDTRECERQFRPKIEGCKVLYRVFEKRDLDFVLAFSSTAAILGGIGLLPYAGANSFLDAFVSSIRQLGTRWISVNWDAWTIATASYASWSPGSELAQYALRPAQAISALDQILASGVVGPVIVSTGDLRLRVDRSQHHARGVNCQMATRMRPVLGSEYIAPTSALEKGIATIWAEVLGIDSIGLHDNLFELGGNSLIGLRIMSRINKQLGTDIKVTALFEAPTVRSLARMLSDTSVGGEKYAESRKRGQSRRCRHSSQIAR